MLKGAERIGYIGVGPDGRSGRALVRMQYPNGLDPYDCLFH